MMNYIKFSDINITGGFWKEKQDMLKKTTVRAVYDRFCDTHRFDALKCRWLEKGEYNAHIFWDSDVAKWIESVAYILAKDENPELEKLADEAIADIVNNMDENGYFNSYYLTTRQDERFKHRCDHELYCAGHLIEAATAYYEATGKDEFLKAMCRYADYIEKVFKIEKSAAFATPGHPELELALVKLYNVTGEKRYLELSRYFIDIHGNNDREKGEELYNDFFKDSYNQDEIPLKDRSTADGHCVRALYLLSAMADVAAAFGDKELEGACKRCFNNIVNKRMYITGGVGSTHIGEAFTIDYHLPNRTAYAETCAAISLVFFARRMQKLDTSSAFADTVERALYNGVLSGVSMDGKSFFYENPLAIDPDFNNVNHSTVEKERYPITERVEVFDCSCCPPNISRVLASVAGFMYSFDEDTLYVDQYMDSLTENDDFYIKQTTCYPENGKVTFECKCNKKYIAFRIPEWCNSFTLNAEYEMKNGYAVVRNTGDLKLNLILDMPAVLVVANRRVHDNAGKVAVMRGPVVYCAEGVDNGSDVCSAVIQRNSSFELAESEFLIPSLKTNALRPKADDRLYKTADDDYEEFKLKLIPYYAFANRGTTEMVVWFNRGF